MRITLTYNEGRSVMSRVADDLAEAMHEVRKHCWHKSHVYELPAVAWRNILDDLRAVAYGPRGGKAEPAESLYSAIAKIADSVRGFELHHAFTEGQGVIGAATEIVPAFITDGGRHPYPPGDFVLLVPHHIKARGALLTVWEPGDWSSVEEPLYSVGFHLRFWRQSGVGGSQL